MKIVRWLGAFGSHGTLGESLSFELTRPPSDEVCAEPVRGGRSLITHAKIGLLVKRQAVKKRFKADVWSVLDGAGRLVKTRKPCSGTAPGHQEAWCAPVYVALVVDEAGGKLSPSAYAEVFAASSKFKLPVLAINQHGHWEDRTI